MRTYYAGFEEVFETHLEAYRAKQRAIVRREVAREPAPAIFVTCAGHYRVAGDGIVRGSSWRSEVGARGAARERLIGTPVPPPQPKHRKGKRARYLGISRPMFPHP